MARLQKFKPKSRLQGLDTRLEELSENVALRPFLLRMLSTAIAAAEKVNQDILARITSRATASDFLLGLLDSEVALESDALRPARQRWIKVRDELLHSEGGVLSAEEVAQLLRITRQGVDKRRQVDSLFAVRMGKRFLYPAWQFKDAEVLPNVEAVLHALADASAWERLGFFLNGNSRLDGDSPLKRLRKGEIDPVLRAARAFGQHGAP